VVIEVQEASDLVSPAYDNGTTTEAEVIRRFQARFPGYTDGLESEKATLWMLVTAP
jgi:hypothetical protein